MPDWWWWLLTGCSGAALWILGFNTGVRHGRRKSLEDVLNEHFRQQRARRLTK